MDAIANKQYSLQPVAQRPQASSVPPAEGEAGMDGVFDAIRSKTFHLRTR